MDRLLNLMTELSIDPLQHATFMQDPARFLAEAGLSPSERSALLRWRDMDQEVARGHWERSAFVADPGPDPSPDPDTPERGRSSDAFASSLLLE